jgi:hypothetical protein
MFDSEAPLTDADFFADPIGYRTGFSAFKDVVRRKFAGLMATRSDQLTLWMGIVGAPWRQGWDGPEFGLNDRDERTRQELINRAIGNARAREPRFYQNGFAADVGAYWMGVTAGHDRDETRIYDREPVIATARSYPDDGFAITWFLATIAGTIYTAAALFPRTHPDLRAIGIIWALENPRKVPLIIHDDISRPHKFPPKGDEPRGIISGILPIAALVDNTDETVRLQKERFQQTVVTRYGVPGSLSHRPYR